MGSSVDLFKMFKGNKDILIETGTFMGGGIQSALDAGYKKVYSCEINRDRVLDASERFVDKPVVIYNASSTFALQDILKEIDESAVIFLDGHFMPYNPDNPELGFGEDTIKEGLPPSPILEELDIISKHHIKNHTILIDDYQCFGTWVFGNVKFEDVVEKIYSINPKYKYTLYGNTVCLVVEGES